VRVVVRRARTHERADEAARGRTSGSTDGKRGEPAHGHHRAEPGNRQQAETGLQSRASAQRAADAGARTGLRDIVNIGVLLADVLVGNKADLGGGNACGLDGRHRCLSLGIGIVNSTDGLHDLDPSDAAKAFPAIVPARSS
jgi:hypothetical protein